MKLSCTECCHYMDGGKCNALVELQCMKKGKCTFFQTCEQKEKSEHTWAEKISAMGMTQRKRYSDLYYGGRLERYAEEVLNTEN